ncbi:ABC transporter permease [Segetibacter koreensis]|uniref:ABC transporter permease n=1 Tax=Segetibacter koreensis TaxID=398037 RepID=UPI000360F1A8|nr:ABC transporter permease [Segetibacter koreensis]
MFKNYIKTAWRSLVKNKFYTAINILGLSIGLTTSILLLMWIQDERSFDKFNTDYNRIYNLSSHFDVNGKEQVWGGVPGPLFKYARSLAQVQNITRVTGDWATFHQSGSKNLIGGLHVGYVDSSFFSVFNFSPIQGATNSLFTATNNVLLTEETAKKIFGTTDIVGKPIALDTTNFIVTGVLKDFPQNSSLRFDALFPMSLYAKSFTASGGNGDWKTIDEDLGDYAFDTYIKLQPNVRSVAIGNALSKMYKDARNGDSQSKFLLQPLADKHLITADGNKSGLRIVQVFIIITILLLAIAAVNYVNLSTARSMARAKEVSVRKVIGANKLHLFMQFLVETLIIFIIVALIALVLVSLLIPVYNDISGKSLEFSLANPSVWIIIGIAVFSTLILSGVYPALHLSSFNPINSLKGKLSQSTSSIVLRKVLVVFQFSISVMLIICTLVISRQMKYISQIDLGYDKEEVFTVPLSDEAINHVDAVKDELKHMSGITATALSNVYNMADYQNSTGDIDWTGKPKDNNMIVVNANVDKDFIPLMNFQFVEGGNFKGMPSDTASYIINETMAKEMGLKPPYVGQQMSVHDAPGVIIGVVKDFHFQSLKTKITPFVFWTQRWKNILYVKTTAARAKESIQAVQKIYNKYTGVNPFTYSFVDTKFDELYKTDNRTKTLFNIFAAIAIFISCLGLLALATYSAQIRTKEIGVRKVLGASVADIVALIAKDFIALVIIAIIIAIPVALYSMNKWLENFAYKTSISYWLFVAASCIAVGIATLTIGFQAIKAAIANPAKSLKTE